MADLRQMSRILYHHDWTNVDDWARNIAALAELNDEEIQQLQECLGSVSKSRARPASAKPEAARVAPFPRSRARTGGMTGTMRLGPRRAS